MASEATASNPTVIELETGLEFEFRMMTSRIIILTADEFEIDYACYPSSVKSDEWDPLIKAIELGENMSVEYDEHYRGLILTVGKFTVELEPYLQLNVSAPAAYYDPCCRPSYNKSQTVLDMESDLNTFNYTLAIYKVKQYLREKALVDKIAKLEASVSMRRNYDQELSDLRTFTFTVFGSVMMATWAVLLAIYNKEM